MSRSEQAPRVKTRPADSGYVYEYYFDRAFDAVYRFGMRADAGPYVPALVELDRKLLATLAGRDLSAVEEFAVAKMSLFTAFDERPDPAAMTAAYRPDSAVIERILTELDLR